MKSFLLDFFRRIAKSFFWRNEQGLQDWQRSYIPWFYVWRWSMNFGVLILFSTLQSSCGFLRENYKDQNMKFLCVTVILVRAEFEANWVRNSKKIFLISPKLLSILLVLPQKPENHCDNECYLKWRLHPIFLIFLTKFTWSSGCQNIEDFVTVDLGNPFFLSKISCQTFCDAWRNRFLRFSRTRKLNRPTTSPNVLWDSSWLTAGWRKASAGGWGRRFMERFLDGTCDLRKTSPRYAELSGRVPGVFLAQ